MTKEISDTEHQLLLLFQYLDELSSRNQSLDLTLHMDKHLFNGKATKELLGHIQLLAECGAIGYAFVKTKRIQPFPIAFLEIHMVGQSTDQWRQSVASLDNT